MTTLTLQSREYRIRSWSLLLLGWIIGIVVLAATGSLAAHNFLMPLLITAPVAGFALAYRANLGFRSLVLSLDTGILVILHSWRMLGLGFVLLYAYNVLPATFALLAGLGDAMAAVGATVIGVRLLRGSEVSKQSLLRWNSYGLIDFLIAITIGTLLRSSLYGGTTNTDPLSFLPLSLIPTLVVPFYIITHLIIFLQLREK
jgi:hypothetical protein